MEIKFQTALITGPTSGIGRQFARELASVGTDLILVSRSEGILVSMCEELGAQFGIEAHFIVADLSQPEAPEQVFKEIQALGVSVDLLVNNAGTHEYGPFLDTEWEVLQSLLGLNLQSVVQLTRLFLPGMIARGHGHILNLGSTGSFVPWPNDAVYGATKAFILRFSEALASELRETGVGVTCLCPGVVETAFLNNGDLDQALLSRLTAMAPERVAQAGLRALKNDRWVYIPGMANKLMIFFQHLVPRRLLTRLADWATKPRTDL